MHKQMDRFCGEHCNLCADTRHALLLMELLRLVRPNTQGVNFTTQDCTTFMLRDAIRSLMHRVSIHVSHQSTPHYSDQDSQ